MDGTKEGEVKGGRRAGQTERTGMDEEEVALQKHLIKAPTETPGVPNWKAATTTGSHGAVQFVNGAPRGARIAAPPKEAPRGVRTETAMRATEEESRLETPPTTGEEDTESGIAETTGRETKEQLLQADTREG